MATTKTAPAQKSDEEIRQEVAQKDHDEKLARQVLRLIGRPTNLHKVAISRVIDDTYRINVYVEDQKPGDIMVVKTFKIEQSFYVHETKEGLVSNPPMVKMY